MKDTASEPFTDEEKHRSEIFARSPPFSAPSAHLDPPLLTLTPCDRDLCVDLRPPVENLRDIYLSMRYSLRIRTNVVEQTKVLYQPVQAEMKIKRLLSSILLLSPSSLLLPVVILTVSSFLYFSRTSNLT